MAVQGDAAATEEALVLEAEAVDLPHLLPTVFQPFPTPANDGSIQHVAAADGEVAIAILNAEVSPIDWVESHLDDEVPCLFAVFPAVDFAVPDDAAAQESVAPFQLAMSVKFVATQGVAECPDAAEVRDAVGFQGVVECPGAVGFQDAVEYPDAVGYPNVAEGLDVAGTLDAVVHGLKLEVWIH